MGKAPSSIKPGFPKAHPTSEKTREGMCLPRLKGQLSKERGVITLSFWSSGEGQAELGCGISKCAHVL